MSRTHLRVAIAAMFLCLLAPSVGAKDKKPNVQAKECCKQVSCCANAADGKRGMKCSCRDGKKCDQPHTDKTSMNFRPFDLGQLFDRLQLRRALDTSFISEPGLPVRPHW